MSLCVIFDLDGTLVDSESICNQALFELLPELNEPIELLTARYRGKQLAKIFADIECRLGITLSSDFEERYRARVATLFEHNLNAVPGAKQMLEKLPHRRCVASSGPIRKIEQALNVCELAGYFEHVFSSYEIRSWKPEPQLFLHAAHEMSVRPCDCIVVEDSSLGIAAAKSAGMRAFQFAPDPTLECTDADVHFRTMAELSLLLCEPR